MSEQLYLGVVKNQVREARRSRLDWHRGWLSRVRSDSGSGSNSSAPVDEDMISSAGLQRSLARRSSDARTRMEKLVDNPHSRFRPGFGYGHGLTTIFPHVPRAPTGRHAGPPPIVRFPRIRPLSRAISASPARAAACSPEIWPSSGISATGIA